MRLVHNTRHCTCRLDLVNAWVSTPSFPSHYHGMVIWQSDNSRFRNFSASKNLFLTHTQITEYLTLYFLHFAISSNLVSKSLSMKV